MQWTAVFGNSYSFFLVATGIIGLMIGSFLNVVIYRLPKMLNREWTHQCLTFLDENAKIPEEPTFNLITPRSRCPHCQHMIGALENIPILSFVFLKGRCKACGQPISWRYPFIELITAIFSVIVAYHFGMNELTFFALIFTWGLIALTVIDYDHQLLPDNIVLPILWLGLLVNINHSYTDLTSAVLGATIGYLFLWSVYWMFKLFTRKEGMGHGDFKLLALLGAWGGWQTLPKIILLSSLVGAVTGITLILLKKHAREKPIPFGPFLAAAGWICFLWNDALSWPM